MKNIFISGSMQIKNINKLVIERIENIINENFTVLVGDAKGVDSSIQEILVSKKYKKVKVYCAGNYPRNNIGGWGIETIQTEHKPNTRLYFTAKDIKMANNCDFGLMIWDSKSTGTLSNVLELLQQKKTSVVFVNKLKKFFTVSNINEFENLVSIMSDSAFNKADKKIKLQEKILSNKHKQLRLFPDSNKTHKKNTDKYRSSNHLHT